MKPIRPRLPAAVAASLVILLSPGCLDVPAEVGPAFTVDSAAAASFADFMGRSWPDLRRKLAQVGLQPAAAVPPWTAELSPMRPTQWRSGRATGRVVLLLVNPTPRAAGGGEPEGAGPRLELSFARLAADGTWYLLLDEGRLFRSADDEGAVVLDARQEALVAEAFPHRLEYAEWLERSR